MAQAPPAKRVCRGVHASPVFPAHSRPTAAECHALHDRLAELYGPRVRAPRAAPQPLLDVVVQTILSQNTTDTNSSRAFAALKGALPTWAEVMHAEPAVLEAAIRCGGLAKTKAARIQVLLRTLHAERGELSLEHLWSMDSAQVRLPHLASPAYTNH